MTVKSNLSKRQGEIIRELKEDESIIICPADKGKAVVVEDREVYLMKTQDQISEGDYVKKNKKEKTIMRNLHKKIVDQLISMVIKDFKSSKYTQ